MIYNIIVAVGFIIMLLLNKLIKRSAHADKIIKFLSIIIFSYKVLSYTVKNLSGNIFIPVEISAITYFLVPIIIIFKIDKIYNIGSFFGMIAGTGFFMFYILLGFIVQNSISYQELLMGLVCHSYLFLSGCHLFRNYNIEKNDPLSIWITVLAMISWAMAFYDVGKRGITFVYYIIKPHYLFIFNNMFANILIVIIYYFIISYLFNILVKLFCKYNLKYSFSTHKS